MIVGGSVIHVFHVSGVNQWGLTNQSTHTWMVARKSYYQYEVPVDLKKSAQIGTNRKARRSGELKVFNN